MVRFIIFILSVLGYLSALYIIDKGKKFAFYPAIMVSAITLAGYVAGMMNVMNEAYTLILFIGFVLLPLCLLYGFMCKEKMSFPEFTSIFPLIVFAIGAIILAYALNGHFLYDYDDFSHWGKIARIISTYQRLPIQTDALSHSSYPPGSALFIAYCANAIENTADVYLFAQAFMLLAFFVSVFALSKKIWIQFSFVPIIAFMMQYNIALDVLSVDNLLASITFAGVIFCLVNHKHIYRECHYLSFFLGTLVLVKNSGIFLCIIILVYALVLCFRNSKKIRWNLLFIIVPLVVFFGWKMYCRAVFDDIGKHALSIEYYKMVLGEKQGGNLWQSLSVVAPMLILPSKNHALYLLPGFVILAVFARKNKKYRHIFLFAFLLFVIYEVGIILMYVLSMPLEELLNKERHDYLRYNGTIVVVLVAIQLFLLVNSNLLSNKSIIGKVSGLIAGSLIMCMVGYSLSLKYWPLRSVERRMEKNQTVVQLMQISEQKMEFDSEDTVVILFSEKASRGYHELASCYYIGTEHIECCYSADEVEGNLADIPWAYFIDLYKNEVVLPRETNGILLYTDSDDSNVLDAVGYKENTRYSRWSSGDVNAIHWDTTGYIPIAPKDIIRLYNVTWYPSEENNGYGSIYWYEKQDSFMGKIDVLNAESLFEWNPVYDEKGNIIEIIVPKGINSKLSYIRLTCQNIDQTSVITVNETMTD